MTEKQIGSNICLDHLVDTESFTRHGEKENKVLLSTASQASILMKMHEEEMGQHVLLFTFTCMLAISPRHTIHFVSQPVKLC